MKYTLAFVAAIAGAAAATMQEGGYGAPVSSAAPATTPAAEQKTSTLFQTEVDTIISCGPEVTNCPGKSTEIQTTAPATTKPVETTPVPTTAPATTKPVETTPVPTTTPVKTSTPVTSEVIKSTTPVATTETPKTTAPATSQPPVSTVVVHTSSSSAAPPPPPPVTLVSTQAIETCVPTTIYHTVTIVSTTTTEAKTTPVATSKAFSTAPYGTAPASKPTGGVASGTGAIHTPTGPPIATGAAVANSVPLSGMALAAAAYLLF